MDIADLTATQLRDAVAAGRISAQETTEIYLERIKTVDPRVRAFITIFEDTARAAAKEIDKKIARKENAGLLAGVPVAIKDNICIKGGRTTCASRMLDQYMPPYDAHIIERLRAEGAVFLGKTNLDEFAMGSSTENSGFFTTKNPWDLSRIPGGSSGGSATAVAARMAPLAVGSDTGGSIRQPAALCGVVGMKPTYGRVSRYGLIAFGSSLDQIGPFGRTVEDAALLLTVLAGHDARDATSLPGAVPDYVSLLNKMPKKMRIGLPREYFIEGLHPEVRTAVEKAVQVFRAMPAEIKEVSLPHTGAAVAVYYIIAPSEASANLARYDGIKYGYRDTAAGSLIENYEQSRSKGFGDEVKRRIMLGTYALSAGYYDAYYAQAQKVRTLIQEDFIEAFKHIDVLLMPTTPTPAFEIGEKTKDPLQMYLSDIFTISANLAGLPSVSVPCGFSSDNLPIGLQLCGPLQKDEIILQAAYAFQKATDFHTKAPTISEQ